MQGDLLIIAARHLQNGRRKGAAGIRRGAGGGSGAGILGGSGRLRLRDGRGADGLIFPAGGKQIQYMGSFAALGILFGGGHGYDLSLS